MLRGIRKNELGHANQGAKAIREAKMSEFRRNPLAEGAVIIASTRSKRPHAIKQEKKPEESVTYKKDCPFCPGNETQTPPEVFAFREKASFPDGPGWRVRVVPNKFAALEQGVPFSPLRTGILAAFSGNGKHEVIVEDPCHKATLASQSQNQLTDVLRAWQARYVALAREKGLAYTQIFKNYGASAGASLSHPHSQLLSLPLVPPVVAAEIKRAQAYYAATGECLWCTLWEKEGERRVLETETYGAFCPYFSRLPFETWVLPHKHAADFAEASSSELSSLAFLLRSLARKIKTCLQDPPFNLILHTLPYRQKEAAPFYHWHLEFLPQLTTIAGFEWGTGLFINPTSPEEAAKILREAN